MTPQYNRPYCEMTSFENSFLIGLLGKYRPKNIIEIGVSAGATTSMALEFIKRSNPDAKLTSLDISEKWYVDPNKQTGFLALEKYANNSSWKFQFGHYLPEFLATTTEQFDFCILDTVHSLPGEVLDFLAILPFMPDGAVLVVHDFHWHLYSNEVNDHATKAYATKVLLDTACGEKIICRDPQRPAVLPNIAALIIDQNTRRYITNTFSSLSMPWQYALSDHEFQIYLQWYTHYYGVELAEVFTLAHNLATQRYMAIKTAELVNNVVELEKYIYQAKAQKASEGYFKTLAEMIMKTAVDAYNQGLNAAPACLARLASQCQVPLKNLHLLEAASYARDNNLLGALNAINQELKDFPQSNGQAVEMLVKTVQGLLPK
ncbi:MAG: class I SAM-dependent methyltransferase [Desulfovibrionaceae bacterium]|nr:class I SAM-dependent methyltransferase [Desulfovibrionaceae bacterium]